MALALLTGLAALAWGAMIFYAQRGPSRVLLFYVGLAMVLALVGVEVWGRSWPNRVHFRALYGLLILGVLLLRLYLLILGKKDQRI